MCACAFVCIKLVSIRLVSMQRFRRESSAGTHTRSESLLKGLYASIRLILASSGAPSNHAAVPRACIFTCATLDITDAARCTYLAYTHGRCTDNFTEYTVETRVTFEDRFALRPFTCARRIPRAVARVPTRKLLFSPILPSFPPPLPFLPGLNVGIICARSRIRVSIIILDSSATAGSVAETRTRVARFVSNDFHEQSRDRLKTFSQWET